MQKLADYIILPAKKSSREIFVQKNPGVRLSAAKNRRRKSENCRSPIISDYPVEAGASLRRDDDPHRLGGAVRPHRRRDAAQCRRVLARLHPHVPSHVLDIKRHSILFEDAPRIDLFISFEAYQQNILYAGLGAVGGKMRERDFRGKPYSWGIARHGLVAENEKLADSGFRCNTLEKVPKSDSGFRCITLEKVPESDSSFRCSV